MRCAQAALVLSFASLVVGPALFPAEISYWTLDGTLDDSGPGGNHGLFNDPVGPTYTDGFDGTPDGAVLFDGVDDFIRVPHNSGLPLHSHAAFSIAMWVKGNGMLQADKRVFSESATTINAPLFNLGTHNQAVDGTVDFFYRNAANQTIVNHLHSQRPAFDDTWRHIAWVDDNGAAALYIDGVRDGANFSYTRAAMPFDMTTIGGILRAAPCCLFIGAIDEVHVYDHALSEAEVRSLIPTKPCPEQGDTHCASISVEGPVDGGPGLYTVRATGALDDSGDPIQHTFSAESAAGARLTVGPQAGADAVFNLAEGDWTLRLSVDDDLLCEDLAGDATCSQPLAVRCPAAGDTHCGGLTVSGPANNLPGLYSLVATGAIDDSGDAILYTFSADNGVDPPQRRGPQAVDFVDLTLAEGTWTLSVTIDDGAVCGDVAPDATCSTEVAVTCPAAGDTHCGGLDVIPTGDGLPGNFTFTVLDATDDSGDLVSYAFRAENGVDAAIVVPPGPNASVTLALSAGDWTLRATVDDDAGCPDAANDATCTVQVHVDAPPRQLVSHWLLDGDLEDSQPAGNSAVFFPDLDPIYVDGFDGTLGGAASFDGVDDYAQVTQNSNLPIYANRAYSVALWVKGLPQTDRRVFSEGSTLSNTPLLNIGTHFQALDGRADIFIRTAGGVAVVNHRLSGRMAFDDAWHHLAWIDDNGQAVLYIDGVRDATDYSYTKAPMALDTTSIGGIVRAAPSHWFAGALDDVRAYNYALSAAEVEALVPEPQDCPGDADTHCGALELTGPDGVPGAPPAGNPVGLYQLSATGAVDESGDPILYTFVATSDDGRHLQSGPDPASTASLFLVPGKWTIRVTVDDSIRCRDLAPDASCSQPVEVRAPEPRLVSRFHFDAGDVSDQAGDNEGSFFGGAATPTDDPEGAANNAIAFDGVDDLVQLNRAHDLPLSRQYAFSVAMWVRGGPQPDRRVFAEASTLSNTPLFNIGTQNGGTTGQVDIYIRDDANAVVVNHVLSQGIAFDNSWHHLAWTDVNGQAALSIDGRRDAQSFNYVRPANMTFNTTTIGGIARLASSHWFNGSIDEVRLYNYALSDCEVEELALDKPCQPPGPIFRRGDCNGDGAVTGVSDAITMLTRNFVGGVNVGCVAACDANGDGSTVGVGDAIALLTNNFVGNVRIPPPFPGCGTSELASDEALGCLAPPTPCK